MLALEQSTEKWPFSTGGGESFDRSDPPPPGYGPDSVHVCTYPGRHGVSIGTAMVKVEYKNGKHHRQWTHQHDAREVNACQHFIVRRKITPLFYKCNETAIQEKSCSLLQTVLFQIFSHPSVLWRYWLGHLTRIKSSTKWHIMCRMGR